eukprot:scaffold22514_cov62-Phaeocystis_antarctica.AAC.2
MPPEMATAPGQLTHEPVERRLPRVHGLHARGGGGLGHATQRGDEAHVLVMVRVGVRARARARVKEDEGDVGTEAKERVVLLGLVDL